MNFNNFDPDDEKTAILDKKRYKKDFNGLHDVFSNYSIKRSYEIRKIKSTDPVVKIRDLDINNKREFYFYLKEGTYLQIGKEINLPLVGQLNKILFPWLEIDPGKKLSLFSLLIWNVDNQIKFIGQGLLLKCKDKIYNENQNNVIIEIKKLEIFQGFIGPWWKFAIRG